MSPAEFLSIVPPQVVPWLEIQRRVSPDRGQSLLQTFAKMKEMWLHFEIPQSQLAAIALPTLVMAGDQDMIEISHTLEIWESVPGAKLCIAPDATHFWLEEKSELANRAASGPLLRLRPFSPPGALEPGSRRALPDRFVALHQL